MIHKNQAARRKSRLMKRLNASASRRADARRGSVAAGRASGRALELRDRVHDRADRRRVADEHRRQRAAGSGTGVTPPSTSSTVTRSRARRGSRAGTPRAGRRRRGWRGRR